MRVHILAKELNVTSKAILLKCAAEGLPVKNHMTALGPGLEATIREWFTEGQHLTTVETAERVDLKKVRVARRKKKAAAEVAASADQAVAVAEAPAEVAPVEAEVPEAAAAEVAELAEAPPGPEVDAALAPPEAPPEEAATVPSGPAVPGPVEAPAAPAEPEVAEPVEGEPAPERMVAEVEAPGPTAALVEEAPGPLALPEPVRPAGPQNVPAPARVQGPRVVRYEPPERDYHPPPRSPRRPPPAPGPTGEPMPPPAPERAGERRRGAGAGAGAQRGRGRAATVSPRRTIRRGSDVLANEKLQEWRNRDLEERRERLRGATGRKVHRRRAMESQGTAATVAPVEQKTRAQVHEPIQIKEFCSAVGVSFIKLMRTLQRDHDMVVVNINSVLPTDMAEVLALDEGIDLEIIKPKTRLDLLREESEQRPLTDLGPRPPVVTFLGHVDHGKTTLLDAIRRTRVAQSEDGGITQHIGSYHLEQDGVAVTFLDTPGHAAFTAMRARGAQLTDIVVLVVAADDGVMPQTIEAINHAKAAEVPIVVAITKIDLGFFDENRIYGQLAEHGLTPSGAWGGTVDVIKTSGVTGAGIDKLLEHLTALGELLELTASHSGDPVGTVIEAETKEGVGAVVRVLVQSGKLRPGMMLVCGNAYGKVRALLDDQGRRLTEAGPSMPAEVWGLDEVPSAGDRFYGLKNAQRAKMIAEEVRHQRVSRARIGTQKARTLEDVFKQRDAEGIPELDVIIRADVDGSVDALRHALTQLPTDQVNLVIRHAGVGAVVDSDVLLADACDAIVIAFRVVAGATTRKLADEHGVDIREYKVIYNVIDDIVKALEGLLEPEEKLEMRATAEVRSVFKVSKVGIVAGCYLSDGTLSRDHVVRLIRAGVVVREDCKIASLRRFKDDAKEIRQGMECGVRLEGFDDVKEGDVVEAYEVVKVARTL